MKCPRCNGFFRRDRTCLNCGYEDYQPVLTVEQAAIEVTARPRGRNLATSRKESSGRLRD